MASREKYDVERALTLRDQRQRAISAILVLRYCAMTHALHSGNESLIDVPKSDILTIQRRL